MTYEIDKQSAIVIANALCEALCMNYKTKQTYARELTLVSCEIIRNNVLSKIDKVQSIIDSLEKELKDIESFLENC